MTGRSRSLLRISAPALALALAACTTDYNVGSTNHLGSGGFDAGGDSSVDAASNALLAPSFGSARWTLALGGPGQDTIAGVAVDSAGNVIAGGDFQATVDFGDQTLSSTSGAWVSKRATADGHALWSRAFGTGSDETANLTDVSVFRGDDSVIAVGRYTGATTIGTTTLPNVPYGSFGNSFLVKLDASGAPVWVTTLAAADVLHVRVARDGTFALVAIQEKQSTLSFPNGDLTPANDAPVVARYAADGTPLWGISVQDAGVDYWTSSPLAVTSDDRVVFGANYDDASSCSGSGSCSMGLSIGSTAIPTPAGTATDFVAELDATGDLVWTAPFSDGAHYPRITSMAIDASDHIAVGGAMSFVPHSDPTAPFAMSFASDGSARWTYGAASGDGTFDAVAITPAGSVALAGENSDFRVDLGSGVTDKCEVFATLGDNSGALASESGYGVVDTSCWDHVTAADAGSNGPVVVGGVLASSTDYGTGALTWDGSHMGSAEDGNSDAMILVYDAP